MKRWKIILYSILICLPVVLVVGIGGAFLIAEVPKLIRNEPRRVTMLYRECLERFKADPNVNFEVRTNRVGEANGRIDGMPWGRLTENGRTYVWYRALNEANRSEWRMKEVEPFAEFPFALVFYGGGGFVLLVLLVLTVLAVWNFVRFMKERDDFLAATAHDLTTPLVGLRMMIGRNDEEAKVLNERMIRLVDNIKDFLKLGGRRPAPKRETFDLVKAYETAYALFAADYRDLFDGEDIRTSQTSQTSVLADETMTVQILWNLLGNDLKYAAPYGKVSVRFAREGKFVRVEFIDEGQGMTPRQMRKAFDRYYRAKTVLQSGKGGFGIGLCTAKEFARAMGGDLTVRANTPRGCIFSLYLPAAI